MLCYYGYVVLLWLYCVTMVMLCYYGYVVFVGQGPSGNNGPPGPEGTDGQDGADGGPGPRGGQVHTYAFSVFSCFYSSGYLLSYRNVEDFGITQKLA